jgi:hypothetical protein
MEEKFVIAWEKARQTAEKLGVKMRSFPREKALDTAMRCLSGNRDSDGFGQLQKLGRLDLSLEALAVQKANVLGQIKPGIPVWQTGDESKFPLTPYVIFPGNVGEISTLKEAAEVLMA